MIRKQSSYKDYKKDTKAKKRRNRAGSSQKRNEDKNFKIHRNEGEIEKYC